MHTFRHFLAVGTLLAGISQIRAADPAPGEELLKDVSKRLLQVIEPVPDYEWPPDFRIKPEKDNPINAFASAEKIKGKWRPYVQVTPDLMTKIIGTGPDAADKLAYVVGHELGHIVHKHMFVNQDRDRTELLRTTFTRDQELEADAFGYDLMLRASFKQVGARKAVMAMQNAGLDYSSFEGLGKDHPSWDDRMLKLDKEQEKYWRSMAAFKNGALFLATEQYPRAIECFDRVVNEFPNAAEARANLGYARLMNYCDQLSTPDLRTLGVGPVIAVGFCPKDSSIQLRGIDEAMWKRAVADLEAALQAKPDLAIAQAQLGLAYLLKPQSKEIDKAVRLLRAAIDSRGEQRLRYSYSLAAATLNLAAALRLAGKNDEAMKLLDAATQSGNDAAKGRTPEGFTRDLTAALLYHRAAVLAQNAKSGDSEKVADLLEKCVEYANPLSPWYPIALEEYKAACKTAGKTTKTEGHFKSFRHQPMRTVTGVTLKSGTTLNLGDKTEDIVKRLGDNAAVPVVPGRGLVRTKYADHGVDLLLTEELIAIAIDQPEGPSIPLQSTGVGAQNTGTLKIGQSAVDVFKLLGILPEISELTEKKVEYHYYREPGVAVRYGPNDKVAEIVVIRMPSRR